MKIITLVTLAAMFAVVPATQAQQQEQDRVIVPLPPVEQSIELPASYKKMWPDQYEAYKGAYNLSNGQTLSIRSFGTNMVAYIDNEKWHKLVAVAPNTFVALDRQLKMEINLHDDGDANGWVHMVVPAQKLSSGEIVPEKVMSFAMR
ncbi:hypothetical protein [Duganella aceris]|uniref:Uncharacterized protein n=1 Tax=Duganella aceris TaxID=2703883 RepID=A0ABX0FSR5_9BURK|nr:hypothetical protein [Duganella aceris]NGZ87379.1 hypothetical protein [Duganella aceris]